LSNIFESSGSTDGKSLALPKARRRGQNSKKTAQLNMLLLPITFQPRPTFLTMLARCERVRIAALHLPTARRIDWGF